MPFRRLRKTKFISHLADPLVPRQHRGSVLPEEAADAGGIRDRLSVLGGVLMMVALVAGLALVAGWLLAP